MTPMSFSKFGSLTTTVVTACATALLWLLASGAHAGVAEGVTAYDKRQFLEARKELELPASQGDVEAMARMGEMLMRGLGGARDELKARDYITQAHEAGSLQATYLLARMALTGNLVAKDEARGIALMKQAGEKAMPMAQSTLGVWLANGLFGFEKNDAAALAWFKVAAAQKDPQGMYWLGYFYELGKPDLPQDNLQALDWYRKAADAQYSNGAVAAGRLYALGKGVNPDGAEALVWLKKAVGQGNPASYIWMASVYEFGRGGIAKNPSLAYAWYAAVPLNATPEQIKQAAEGKERTTTLLAPGDQQEALKLSKTIVAQTAAVSQLNTAITTLAGASAVRKSWGSGVVVSREGDILTNDHVIKGCQKIRILPQSMDAKVMAKDAKNDLALLRLDTSAGAVSTMSPARLRSSRGIQLGDDLVVVGYPLPGLLSSGAVVTTGVVNAMSGAGNDTSAFQMSATVQPGSSGGPVFDQNGLLVGLVSSRLLPIAPANPQNVNFAINLPTVQGFLDAQAVQYASSIAPAKSPSVSGVAAQGKRSTVQIECY